MKANYKRFFNNYSYIGRSFVRRHLIERIDHLVNVFEENKKKREEVKTEIIEILNFSQDIFKELQKYPFMIKVLKIYKKYGREFIDYEILINSIQFFIEFFPI